MKVCEIRSGYSHVWFLAPLVSRYSEALMIAPYCVYFVSINVNWMKRPARTASAVHRALLSITVVPWRDKRRMSARRSALTSMNNPDYLLNRSVTDLGIFEYVAGHRWPSVAIENERGWRAYQRDDLRSCPCVIQASGNLYEAARCWPTSSFPSPSSSSGFRQMVVEG